MTHLSRISHLDGDMKLVESFVHVHKNPDDDEAQTKLFQYYLEKIGEYWNFAKVYAFDPALEKFFSSLHTKMYYAKPTIEMVEECDKTLNLQIDAMVSKFEQNKRCDIVEICRIFEYISLLSSWCKPSFEKSKESYHGIKGKYQNYTYPLPNDTDLFSLNTYLYAYFQGVHLVGIPKEIAKFDGNDDVPARFIYHDLEHTYDIVKLEKSRDSELTKSVYLIILNDTKLSDLEKDCHITILWFIIHEIYSPSSNQIFNPSNEHTAKIVESTVSGILLDHWSEDWLKYEELVFSEKNLQSFLEYSQRYPQYLSRAQNLIEFSKNPVLDNTYDNDDIGLGNYIFMGLWLTHRYSVSKGDS